MPEQAKAACSEELSACDVADQDSNHDDAETESEREDEFLASHLRRAGLIPRPPQSEGHRCLPRECERGHEVDIEQSGEILVQKSLLRYEERVT